VGKRKKVGILQTDEQIDKCLRCGKCCITEEGKRCPRLSNTNQCQIYNNRLMFQIDEHNFCGLRKFQKRFIEGCPLN
jgi:hypothetical protein